MGYADLNRETAWRERWGRERLGSGAAVIALHVGLGVALLSTFAGGAITEAIDNVIDANNWIDVPPPPPQPHPTTKPAVKPKTDDRIVVPPTRNDLAPTGPMLDTKPLDLAPLKPVDIGGDGPGELVIKPTPTPKPSFAPLLARPRNDPATWVSRNDYPTQAIREGWTGVTRFRLSIGADGRVTGCDVIASSGHDLLDQIACTRVTSRARFTPARDETGAPSPATFQSSIRWQLED